MPFHALLGKSQLVACTMLHLMDAYAFVSSFDIHCFPLTSQPIFFDLRMIPKLIITKVIKCTQETGKRGISNLSAHNKRYLGWTNQAIPGRDGMGTKEKKDAPIVQQPEPGKQANHAPCCLHTSSAHTTNLITRNYFHFTPWYRTVFRTVFPQLHCSLLYRSQLDHREALTMLAQTIHLLCRHRYHWLP